MASASSVSVQKQIDYRRKSCDTVCSSNSSCFLQKRKQAHPLASSVRSSGIRSGGSVGQRVLSAKLLRFRTIQNQLNDANFHLAELAKENRALKTLQKRQDKALSKYEGENADLPKILKTYESEIRVLQEKNKMLRKTLRDITEQLKLKEDELLYVREQLKHLTALTKDRNLKEREKLTDEVQELKQKLQKSEEEISLLNRKLILESKNSKHKLNMEMTRNRQCRKELNEALTEISRLTSALESRGQNTTNRRRFLHVPQRQAVSMVSLEEKSSKHTCKSEENTQNDNEGDQHDNKSAPELVAKLEPILTKSEPFKETSRLSSILKPPSDKIKARLSAKDIDVDEVNKSIEKLSVADNCNETQSHSSKSIYTVSSQNVVKSRPSSSQKLEKLEALIQSTLKKKERNNSLDEDDRMLGDFYTKVISSVKTCNQAVNDHQETLQQSKLDTEKLAVKLQETDQLNKKLQNTNFITRNGSLKDDDDLVQQIINEELLFQKTSKKTDLNGNNSSKDPQVPAQEKQKLLDTLRAIDNGENIVLPVTSNPHRKTNVMKEIFGDIEH